ncbi:hypothetical protein V500_01102 [Pseudogymnoascus sp. VKM F-4518 (FW-2643)]|nr:hypothetical protein V500_01102 [Pseudogymnoascus sp. VKM F-4518 (FW-2643)]
MSQKVPRVGLCKGRPRHREAFLPLARSSRKVLEADCACHSRKRIRCARRRGRAQERQVERNAAPRRRCSKGSLPSQRARQHERRGYRRAGIDVVVLRGVHVPLRVFSCGEAEPGDPLGGAMLLGGGGVAKRRTMSAAGAVESWERSDGGEGQIKSDN